MAVATRARCHDVLPHVGPVGALRNHVVDSHARDRQVSTAVRTHRVVSVVQRLFVKYCVFLEMSVLATSNYSRPVHDGGRCLDRPVVFRYNKTRSVVDTRDRILGRNSM
ncbi:MAG: hypothetical protein JW384_01883 [Nitrosomonadaceae bacterium]|nr:hypothetical protein [Nitrosomonadaceae bacterium]